MQALLCQWSRSYGLNSCPQIPVKPVSVNRVVLLHKLPATICGLHETGTKALSCSRAFWSLGVSSWLPSSQTGYYIIAQWRSIGHWTETGCALPESHLWRATPACCQPKVWALTPKWSQGCSEVMLLNRSALKSGPAWGWKWAESCLDSKAERDNRIRNLM